jgi:carboxymethylenebutenolidase
MNEEAYRRTGMLWQAHTQSLFHERRTVLNTSNNIAEACSLLGSDTGQAPSRRTVLKTTALGVGYAATAGAAVAQTTIKTSSEGLTAGEVMVDVAGFKVPVYVARPAGKTNLPVVLVIQEIFGVHEYIADTARRFAKAGYLAIAPELICSARL